MVNSLARTPSQKHRKVHVIGVSLFRSAAVLFVFLLTSGCAAPDAVDTVYPVLAALDECYSGMIVLEGALDEADHMDSVKEALDLLNSNPELTERICLNEFNRQMGNETAFPASEWLRLFRPTIWEALPKNDLARVYISRFEKWGGAEFWIYFDDLGEEWKIGTGGARLLTLGEAAGMWLQKCLRNESITYLRSSLWSEHKLRHCDLAAAMLLRLRGKPTAPLAAPLADREKILDGLRAEHEKPFDRTVEVPVDKPDK